MDIIEIVLIILAGLWAGAINTAIGSGTLVSFPVLITLGFPPVVATMSNAIGMLFGSVTGTWGYRRELRGTSKLWRRFLPASMLGAAVGSTLLITLPSDYFQLVVPWLLGLALILVLVQPHIVKWAYRRRTAEIGQGSSITGGWRLALFTGCIALIGIYGGYFTAAQGIMLFAVLGFAIPDDLQQTNALKNLLAASVNLVAAATYTIVAFDRVDWGVAALIGVSSAVGSLLGARLARRARPWVLRVSICIIGILAIARLISMN